MSTLKDRNDRWTVAAVVLVGVLLVSSPARSADGILVERDVAVPMSDGTILRAHVFRPAAKGMYPVLVMRTPYGKPAKVDEDLVRAGFIVVTQDARGRYESDGRYESFVRLETHDGSDGRDTVEWAAKLAGSNGKVGLFGTSYPAFLAWRAAGQQPPSLAAMAAFSIPASYLDLEGPGTIRPGRRLKWWYGTISPDLRRKAGGAPPHVSSEAVAKWDAGEGERLLHFLPWQQLPDEMFGTEAPFVKGWLREPWRDPWQLDRDAAHTSVPNLNLCGWYDHCNGSIDLHQEISAHGKSLNARRHSQLIVGPWSHSALGKRRQGEVDFGPEAEVDLTALQIEWFRHWMKGEKQTEVMHPAPVRLFVMGANAWRNFDEWPPKYAAPRNWYLDSDGGANMPSGNGRLVADPPSRGRRDNYRYDPHEPVPTLWTPALFTIPADQKPLAERTDILVYQTPPLESFVETIGYPEVVLHVTSSSPDTDFFARLIDVSPDNKAIDVTMGMVRARYRGPRAIPPGGGDSAAAREALLKPGAVTELKIRLRPTAHRFLAGHRIRLDVTSSDFPNYDRHHNTAANPNEDAELVVAHQTIHHDSARPSRLSLPVMPPKSSAPVR
ncbi:MAG: CocE/NonD family hydrolase [Pirellulaceae bacterium]